MPVNHYMLGDSSDVDPRIRKLFAFGHFANPDHPETLNVTESDLPLLSMDAEVVQEAVRSYQEYFIDTLSDITQEMHGRDAQADGDAGPATSKLLETPRCGVPEYAGREEANIPTECRNDITVSYRFRSINAAVAAAAWPKALQGWESLFELKFRLQAEFSTSTRIFATDKALPGSTLAWSMLAMSRCDFNAEQAYDTTVNWTIEYLIKTIMHEVGHALGMPHHNDRNGIMFPSIGTPSAPNSTDIAAMEQLGYRRRTTPIPPPPDGEMWTGSIVSSGRVINLVGVSQ